MVTVSYDIQEKLTPTVTRPVLIEKKVNFKSITDAKRFIDAFRLNKRYVLVGKPVIH